MLKKVAFTLYPVRDMPRARRFYGDVLGLKEGMVGGRGDQWWVEYDLPGGGCLALTNFVPDQPSAGAGGTIAFEVEDLDALMLHVQAHGGTFLSDVIAGPNCRMRMLLDSEGNSLLLHQLNHPHGS